MEINKLENIQYENREYKSYESDNNLSNTISYGGEIVSF
jgi:hypothetical protein